MPLLRFGAADGGVEISGIGSTLFQTRAHELFHRGLRAEHRLRGTDGIVRLGLLETQRHERERGVIGFLVVGGQRMFGAGRFQRADGSDFIPQFHDDALGSLCLLYTSDAADE